MQNCCSLNEREYEIVYFSDFEKSFEELKLASKIKNKILIHLGNKEISPKFLSYMLKLFRYSVENNFEIFYIIENEDSLKDINIIESQRYFKIFKSIEEYNELKTFAGFEVKIYDDNVYIRNLLKDELVKSRFSIKERNSLNFLKKNHDSRDNSIYIVDFETYKEENIKKIKKIKETNLDSIVILVAFDSGIDYALKMVKYGINAVIKRPFDIKELVRLIKSLATSANLKKENKRLVSEVFKREKEVTRLYNMVNEELKLAGDIQRSLMPDKRIDFKNYTMEYLFSPSMNVGGDFCDFIKIDENKFAVIFADISGHGIPASLLSSMLKVSIYNSALKLDDLPKLMSQLNEEIINIFPKGKFVSMFLVVIDTNNNIMKFCKASQEPALMYKAENSDVEVLETEGQILGLFSKKVFGDIIFEEKTLDFNKGDVLLLYTDGITEETNENGEYYGLERLKKNILSDKLEYIEEDLVNFIHTDKFNDDLTLLRIIRND